MPAPPPSQKLRQIAFRLSGGPGPAVQQALFIRPEELSRAEPSRLTVQQTLGGAWADAWDRGVSTVRLSGTTGWRGSDLVSGEQAFLDLRQHSFADWHARRAAVVAGGGDPNTVELLLVDTLDDFVVLVAPKQFVLRRSKTSPLLMRYTIELTVLADQDLQPGGTSDPILSALADPLRWLGGAGGLENAAASIVANIPALLSVFGA